MRILVVGAAGDIGQVVCDELGQRHDLIRAGRSSGDVQVDLADAASVAAMYAKIGPQDAVISTTGDVHFAPVSQQTAQTFLDSLQQKVIGQVNLVLAGLDVVADGGSFTLTSGILDRVPIPMGSAAAMANGALGGFVRGAAGEMPRGLRINVVSPGLLEVSVPRYGAWFPGHVPVASDRVAQAFAFSVEGTATGQVITVD